MKWKHGRKGKSRINNEAASASNTYGFYQSPLVRAMTDLKLRYASDRQKSRSVSWQTIFPSKRRPSFSHFSQKAILSARFPASQVLRGTRSISYSSMPGNRPEIGRA